MTISFQLAPEPKWYFADLAGKPLGGGYMATYNSPNKTLLQTVFQDISGQFPWPYVQIPNTGLQGILIDENGTQGPFYFQVDTANPQNTYFLEVFDSNGVLQWTIDNFSPPGSGGGGGGTTALSIQNLVTNNVMYRNIGASATPIGLTALMLAPGAHEGLTKTPANANPDIWFIKNNTAATDTLTFTTFSSDGSILNGDVTPVQFLNYTCSIVGAGETSKYVQFPITQNVYNLNNQAMTISIWARVNSGAFTLTLKWRQFFGDGAGATTDQVTIISNLALANSWQQFVVSANVPPLPSPLVLGACGNSGLFLEISYPLTAQTSIDFTKPALYLGSISPTSDYSTYDMIGSVFDSPRTGDISMTLTNSWLSTNNVCPFGWLFMNDGTIGSSTSGASARANIDTFPLYNLIWNNVDRKWAPLVGATTGSAIGDFTANLPLYLTRALGRVFAGTLNTEVASTWTYASATPIFTLTLASTASFPTGAPVTLTTTGTLPTGISNPLTLGEVYYVINLTSTTLALATTLANAVALTHITFDGTTGSGTQTINVTPYMLGQTVGVTDTVLPMHDHGPPLTIKGSGTPTGGASTSVVKGSGTTGDNDFDGRTSNTGVSPLNQNYQPTTFMDVYIKL